mmetsp:Transcript_7288/g.20538  ORF Transcript_7288/g.20538 Transcript_7288/m.20538 type:complete len:298 (+) Transcript_7288:97-990(+)
MLRPRMYVRTHASTKVRMSFASGTWQEPRGRASRPAKCAKPWRPSPDAPCEQAGRSLVRRQLSAVCLAIASGSACSPSLGTRSSIAATPQIATMPFFWCTAHGPLARAAPSASVGSSFVPSFVPFVRGFLRPRFFGAAALPVPKAATERPGRAGGEPAVSRGRACGLSANACVAAEQLARLRRQACGVPVHGGRGLPRALARIQPLRGAPAAPPVRGDRHRDSSLLLALLWSGQRRTPREFALPASWRSGPRCLRWTRHLRRRPSQAPGSSGAARQVFCAAPEPALAGLERNDSRDL